MTRAAGAAGALTLDLSREEGALDVARLRLDGKPFAAGPWKRDRSSASLEGLAALAALRALRDGRVLSLADGSKDPPGASLAGFAAAMLAVDEAQGRLGGVTAIARPGPAPAASVPPPPPLPVIVAAPRPPPLRDAKAFAAAVRHARAADLKAEDCDPTHARYDEAKPLSATEAVVILSCTNAAYQGSALVYVAPVAAPAQARPLAPPPLPGAPKNEPPDNRLVDPEYEVDTATLSSSAKGRGLADCGESMAWTYDGKAFRPSAYGAQGRCGGGAPGEWPGLWRTVVVRAKGR
jgi:hypothetical protein